MNESKQRPDDSIYGVKPNWIGMAIGLLCFLVLSGAMQYVVHREIFIPNAHELPLFLAPMISCGVAYAVFFDAVVRIKSDSMFNILNLACMIAITMLGVFLTVFHGWRAQLVLMGLMFAVFILWDIFVIRHDFVLA